MDDKETSQYSKNYSENSFWQKIRRYAGKAGVKVTYIALLLYYVLQKPTTPKWVKTMIIAALGYFIAPADAILDIIPIAGYTDDVSVLSMALNTATVYIDEEVQEQARRKLRDWFGTYDEEVLKEIDDKII